MFPCFDYISIFFKSGMNIHGTTVPIGQGNWNAPWNSMERGERKITNQHTVFMYEHKNIFLQLKLSEVIVKYSKFFVTY